VRRAALERRSNLTLTTTHDSAVYGKVFSHALAANETTTLKAMPFRNSGINGAHGIFDWSAAAGVFAQARPTADRLA
jgi:hypothetical protein